MTSSTHESRFRIPSLFEIFWGKLANWFRTLAKWRKQGLLKRALEARRRAIRLEALEPRVLLSADPVYAAASGPLADATLGMAVSDEARLPEATNSSALVIDYNSAPTSGAEVASLDDSDPIGTRGQTVFLSFDGAAGVDYDGPVHIADVEIVGFDAPAGLEGRDSEIVASVIETLQAAFSGSGITFTTEQPGSGDYSTIHIGGDGEAFSDYGQFYGLSEQIDVGNRDRSDNAFVFSENISAQGLTAEQYGGKLAAIAAHELGHLLGFEHAHESGEDAGPLAEVAFDPKVHVEIGKDARADVLSDDDMNGIADGKVTIAGNEYAVHPKLVAALRDHMPSYNAGTVAGDGFPDVVMGQFAIHPIDHATWLTRVLDMAWAAQNEPWFTDVEKSQILAWTYGFLTHSAGDHFAHTLVNQFAEGVAPGFFAAATSIPTDQRDLANMLRHFMTEAYIADALEGVDTNPDRTEVAPGDFSDISTPGIAFEAPIRFIYDALIRPFPNDPTAIVEMAWKESLLGSPAGTLAIDGNKFVRTEGKWGPADSILPGTPGDGFKVGHKITVSGFSNAANNGTFIVKAVTDHELTVDATLVDETASGDETIKVFVPKTEKTTITVKDRKSTR